MSALSFRKFLVRAAVLGAAGAFLDQGTSAVLLKIKRADESHDDETDEPDEPLSSENFPNCDEWLRESDKKTFTILASKIRDLKAMPNSTPEDLITPGRRGTADAMRFVGEAQAAIYEMRFDHRIVHAGHDSGLGNIKSSFSKNPFELFKAFHSKTSLELWLRKDASEKIPKDTIAYLEKVAELGKLVQAFRVHQQNVELDMLNSELALSRYSLSRDCIKLQFPHGYSFPMEKGSDEAGFFTHLFKQYAGVETTEDGAWLADGSLSDFKRNVEHALHVAKDFYTEYALGSYVGEYDLGSGNLSAFARLYAQRHDAYAGFADKFGADREITQAMHSKERLINSRAKLLDQQVRPLLRENAKIFEAIRSNIQHMPKLSADDLVKMGFLPCSACDMELERVFQDDALNHILFLADKYASVFSNDSDALSEPTKKYFASLRRVNELVTAIRSNMKEAADIQRFSYLRPAMKALLDLKKAEKMIKAMLINEGLAKKEGLLSADCFAERALAFSDLLMGLNGNSLNFKSALPPIEEKISFSYEQFRLHRADPDFPTHKPQKISGKSQEPAKKAEKPATKAENPAKKAQKSACEEEDDADDDDGNSDKEEAGCCLLKDVC